MEWNHSATKYLLFFSLPFSPCFPFSSKPLHTSYFMNNGNSTWRKRSTWTPFGQLYTLLLQTLITLWLSHPHTPIYNTTRLKLSTSFQFRGFKTRNQTTHYFIILNKHKYVPCCICMFMITYHSQYE
jgi:hypothetical protein